MMQIIPVLFCLIAIVSATSVLLPGGLLFAAPPEEKLPELSKPQLHREKTPLEKAVDRAAAMLLQGKLPPTEDGVRFALWLYGEKGDVAYRDVATRMARENGARAGDASLLFKSNESYFKVAQAGGPTYNDGYSIFMASLVRTPSDVLADMGEETVGGFLLCSYAGLAAGEDLSLQVPRAALSMFWSRYTRRERNGVQVIGKDGAAASLTGYVTALRVATESAQFFGGDSTLQVPKFIAYEMVSRFLDKKTSRFRDGTSPDSFLCRDNLQSALAVWEVGVLLGDKDLRERGQKALEIDLEAALQDTNAAAIAGLAAARMSHHHLQLAIIGDPRDSTIAALRQAAYFLFEPNKVILNLDPKTDSARMAELMYPADSGPSMFVCVETLCSPPIKDPAELEKQVAEIKKLAAQVEQ